MYGGNLIGQGTYGCIFSPAPHCNPPPSKYSRETIAKVYAKKEHTKDELRLAGLLSKIDSEQYYFIYPLAVCETKMKYLAQDPDADQCKFIGATKTEPDHAFPMVVMPRLNSSMIKLLMTERINPRDFARAIAPVFDGLALLAKNKIVHNDIKFDNILYDAKDRVFKIIDFGISVDSKSAFLHNENLYINSRYWLHPPEYRAWSYLRRQVWAFNKKPMSDPEIRDVFKDHMNILNISLSKEINMRRCLLEYHNYCDYERSFIDWMRVLTKKADLKSATAFINKYYYAIDVYCLGLNLTVCLKYLDESQDPVIYKKIKELTTAMTVADPRKRPRAKDVAKILAGI